MIAFEPGDEYAGLRIEREIGRGAYGRVYLAEDPTIGRRVALKVLTMMPGRAEGKRALREARMVGRIQSPHTVTLYRAIPIEEDGNCILEMEYVAGGSLKELLAGDEPLPLDRAVELARDIFTGLKAAHEAGVIHGDIKPGNVLLDPAGRAKLADFGLGWALDETIVTGAVNEGLGGTPAYMAPEVVMGERGRAAADLWSAGVVLHRMLSGAPPFPVGSLQELFAAVQNEPPLPLPPSVPERLRELVGSLLAKNPIERPPSAAAALNRLEGQAVVAHPAPVAATPVAKAERPSLPPLFGRDEEMATLRGHLDSLSDGKGALVLLSGDVGVGKTALIRHLAEEGRAANATVLEANATELDGLLRPLHRACRRTLSLGGELTIGPEARAAIETELSQSRGDGIVSREQMGWALEQFLGALAERAPVVVVVDNVHLARSEEVVVLRELARALRERPVLLLVSCLAAGTETSTSTTKGLAGFRELAALEGVVHHTLPRIPSEAVLQMLHDRNEGLLLDSDVARRVVNTAEGNPLLAIELLRHLQDTGRVLVEGSTLRSSGEWSSDLLPQHVHDVVAQRLDGLDEDARELVEAAAVDGRVFDAAAVAVVVERPLLQVLRALQRLYRERRLVEPDGDAFRFGARVIHEVIYAQVAPAFRKALHERLAQHYTESGAALDPERLAVHWERAGRADLARPYLVKAAHRARKQQDDVQVVKLFERAGLVAQPLPEDWIRDDPASVLALCRALDRLDASEVAISLAEAVADRCDNEAVAMEAGVQRELMVYYARGPETVDRELLRKARGQDAPSSSRGDAAYLEGVIAKHAGDLADAERLFRAANEDYVVLDLALERLSAMQQLASVALRRESFEEAEAMFEDAARQARAIGQRNAAVPNEVNAVVARIERGELEGADERLERAVHELHLNSGPFQAAHAAGLLAVLRLSVGDMGRAEEILARSREYIAGGENLVVESVLSGLETRISFARGDVRVALDRLANYDSIARRSGSLNRLIELASLHARVHACLGDRDAAVAALREIDAGDWTADSWRALAALVPLGLPAEILSLGPFEESATWLDALRELAAPARDRTKIEPLAKLLRERSPGRLRMEGEHLRRVVELAALAPDVPERAELARAALRDAERSGDVWWEAYWLRETARESADEYYEERLDELIVRIARTLPDATAQRRLMVAWAPSS